VGECICPYIAVWRHLRAALLFMAFLIIHLQFPTIGFRLFPYKLMYVYIRVQQIWLLLENEEPRPSDRCKIEF
jgi:hypothetical protein